MLVHEGPEGVRDLIRMGTQFDKENGEFALTKEGAHSQRRILHAQRRCDRRRNRAGADRESAGQTEYRDVGRTFRHRFVTDDGECCGVIVQKPDGSAIVRARQGDGAMHRRRRTAVPLYDESGSRHRRRNGDGLSRRRDHPRHGIYPVSSDGAMLSRARRVFSFPRRCAAKGRCCATFAASGLWRQYHPQLELAPRDVVARAIVSEMEKTQVDFRLPGHYARIRSNGEVTLSDDLRILPAIRAGSDEGLDSGRAGGPLYDGRGEDRSERGDDDSRGLFACGEVSSTGVHGANRLASNSLSEAIVFGRRIVQRIDRTGRRSLNPMLRSLDEDRSASTDPADRREAVEIAENHAALCRAEAAIGKDWRKG